MHQSWTRKPLKNQLMEKTGNVYLSGATLEVLGYLKNNMIDKSRSLREVCECSFSKTSCQNDNISEKKN